MEEDSGEKQKSRTKHSCIICGKNFLKKNALLIHERIHTGEKPYECEICKNTFSQSSSLTKHKRIHTGLNQFECEICNKMFSRKDSLTNHKRIHTGDRPYQCDVCEKAFSQNVFLAKHKMIHTGEKPYECESCKKIFSRKDSLANHKRVHTGEKPYSCNICKKSFTQNSSLSSHLKTSAHLKREESKNIDSTFHRNTFGDCGEIIKIENIKGEINEEESDEDPLSIHLETENSNIYEDIKEEVKEEESIDDPLSVEEGERRSENDNNHTVVKEEGIDDDTLFVQQIHKTAAHIERMKSKNINHPLTQFSVVDCDGTIKEEDIKKDVKEVENVDDPSFMSYSTGSHIKKEIKEEMNEGFDDSNLDTDNLVDCSEYVQVQMNLI